MPPNIDHLLPTAYAACTKRVANRRFDGSAGAIPAGAPTHYRDHGTHNNAGINSPKLGDRSDGHDTLDYLGVNLVNGIARAVPTRRGVMARSANVSPKGVGADRTSSNICAAFCRSQNHGLKRVSDELVQ